MSAAIELPKKPNGSELMVQPNMMDLLQIALTKDAAIDVIERLAALREKELTRDAEILFNEAMNRVQAEIKRVAPNLDNSQTGSRYASYAQLDKVIRPIYVKEGFSLSFDTDDCPKAEMVRMVCYVSHSAGHTRKYKIDMPADGKGAKGGDVMTKTHATAAATSYGRRYLLVGIFNVAVGSDDNDGNVEASPETIRTFEGCRDYQELDQAFRAAFKAAKGDQRAQEAIIAAKDKRKAAIRDSQPQGVPMDWSRRNA